MADMTREEQIQEIVNIFQTLSPENQIKFFNYISALHILSENEKRLADK